MARLLRAARQDAADTLPTGPFRSIVLRPARRGSSAWMRPSATLMVWVLLIGGIVYLARMGNHKSSAKSPAPSASASAQGFVAGRQPLEQSLRCAQRLLSDRLGAGRAAQADTARPPGPAWTGGFASLQMNKRLRRLRIPLPANSN